MEWFESFYLGTSISGKKRETVRKEVETGRFRGSLYVITLASNGKDLLDIRTVSSLRQSWIRENLPLIVGVADGKEEAVLLAAQIISDSAAGTGEPDPGKLFHCDG